ncbi:MAG: acyltransferase family protein [Steroidobacteraceae bacterium]
MTQNVDPTQGYRPDIDGLRAFAIVLVVAYHYFGLPGGYVGVDVFFVISGYLITGILLSDLQRRHLSLREFYARRIRRILPPLLVVIATSLLVGWVCLLPYDLRELSEEACASAVYVVNFLLWHQSGYFDVGATTKPLLHLWSLAIEEQFYLLWPAFLLLANWCRRRVDLGILGILIASLLVNLITIQDDQATAFYFPVSRLWELAAGGLLVQLERGRKGTSLDAYGAVNWPQSLRSGLSILGLALILSTATLYTREMKFPGYLALIPVIGAVLVLAAGPNAWPNARILAWPPMVHVGKRSYSLYLWHWPVLVLATLIAVDRRFSYFNEACLVVSCLLAWGTFAFCEWPIRRIPVTAGNAWRFLAVGICASVAVAAVGLLLASGTLARASDARLITKIYQRPEGGCTFSGPALNANTAIFAPCEIVKLPGRPVVVLIGDSHAKELYSGLKVYLDARQINLIEYTATGCAPLLVRGADPSCAATYEYVLKKIRSYRPNLVILSAHYLTYGYGLSAGYEKFVVQRLAQLQHEGPQNVLLVGQMPIWGNTLPWILNQDYLRLGQAAPTRMFTGLLPESLKIDATMKSASENLGVPYYSLKGQLCNAQGCLTRVGDRLPDDLIVFDDGHLTVSGARYLLATGLGQRIDWLLAGRK